MGWDYCNYQQRGWGRGGEHVLLPHFEKEGGKAMFFVVVSFESFIPPV